MTNFESVKKFMETFGQEVKSEASYPKDKIIRLRLDLIREELSELKEAVEKKRHKRSCRCFNGYTLCDLWSRARIWN